MKSIILIGLGIYDITTILVYGSILIRHKYNNTVRALDIIRTISVIGAFVLLFVSRITGDGYVTLSPLSKFSLFGILILLIAESLLGLVKGDRFRTENHNSTDG